MSAWRTYYHLVWATHHREHWLTPERMTMLQQAFRVVAKDQGAFTHAVGGMPDHVHVAVSIPPTIAVSEYVQRLKGSSSRFINKSLEFPELDGLTWQREFGVDTFGQRSLPDVVAYIENQAERHANNDLWQTFESLPPKRGS
ncbi:MAG: IS200/IS605 family transposase [Thermomicrobiales bacterium]|nr:IS200/IS605 family transposase [Thermomicrobiales bacterium]